MKTIAEFIEKWECQKDMWRRCVEDPLMYTKEERLKASHHVQVLCSVLSDAKSLIEKDTITTHDLKSIDQARDDYYNRDKLCEHK